MSRITSCRSCAKDELLPVLSLGALPLSDGFLAPEDLDRPEPRYPLDVVFCPACGLVQILDTVPPEVLFGHDYPYFSSVSQTLLEHTRRHVAERLPELPENAFVLEIASNDGYLLQFYRRAGVRCLGIDPAPGPVAAARAKGIETIRAFFDRGLAETLARDGLRADLVHANNVLAHVADAHGFLDGIRLVLADDGRAVIEVPYLRDLVDKLAFDTIYHEHLCYFSVHAVERLARPHGLFLVRVERVPVHGGSLRLFFAKKDRKDATVDAILAEEKAIGLDRFAYCAGFAARVERLRADLRALLEDLVRAGARVAAYGAAAKGTILLNACGLGRELVAWVADKNPFKQGRFVPGVRLPVVPPSRILEDMPDYLLILPWNIEAEIVAQEALYRERGGRFVVPVPSPRVLA
ncbi:MAG: class I SAM-dependent methyltransferase [Geminicoccaceae bacterium]|nr:class I SAM-dependent methyltransferase [Geminicoccaceae bacterium]MCS7268384.1 class I SAM-dependent methyltransferase [Geminicoccaceae bacterium]MDW8124277.1 class I SAM-dependent methyltransferase [Geminicoccaceae bacterium]MDW8341114.1 class I SAM-dependent methyltransferase [Geminicoccaceae bacterium]